MDNPTNTTTDDAELAKVLESMNENAATAVAPTDDTPVAGDVADTPGDQAIDSTPQPSDASQFEAPPLPPVGSEEVVAPDATMATPVAPESFAPPTSAVPAVTSELDSIKRDAVEELRPLVDKLNLPADEKFDTLLLIIRSTDDKALIGPAHEAAKAITDETKRAQALLDVIKEIDYFSQNNK